jgi:hypothetical protein
MKLVVKIGEARFEAEGEDDEAITEGFEAFLKYITDVRGLDVPTAKETCPICGKELTSENRCPDAKARRGRLACGW